MDNRSSRLCPLAWKGLAYYPNGTYTLCCRSQVDLGATYKEAINSPQLSDIKKQMREGAEPQACQQCFKEEKNQVQSLRQRMIKNFRSMESTVDYSSDSHTLHTLDVRLSNICNLKCRMCSPFSSSKIQQEYEKMKEDGIEFKHFEKQGAPFWPSEIKDSSERVEELLAENRSLEYLRVSGGEPFLDQNCVTLLDGLIEKDRAKDIRLDIHTNGTIFNQQLFSKLNQFNETLLKVSIDGSGNAFEYIRSGAKWPHVENNLKQMTEQFPKIQVTLLFTFSIYNLLYFEEFLEWFIPFAAGRKNPDLAINFVHYPQFMSVAMLPQEFREELVDSLQKYQRQLRPKIMQALQSIATWNQVDGWTENLRQLQYVTQQMDLRRNQSCEAQIPKTHRLIERLIQA